MFASLANRASRLAPLAAVMLMGGLLSACGDGDDGVEGADTTAASTSTTRAIEAETTVAATTTTEVPVAVLATLSFDGENCTYDGTAEVEAGSRALEFHNEWDRTGGEGRASMFLGELLGDWTIQDQMIQIEENPYAHHDRTKVHEILSAWRPVESGETHRWEGDLEPGTYFVACATMSPPRGYWGAGLTVTD